MGGVLAIENGPEEIVDPLLLKAYFSSTFKGALGIPYLETGVDGLAQTTQGSWRDIHENFHQASPQDRLARLSSGLLDWSLLKNPSLNIKFTAIDSDSGMAFGKVILNLLGLGKQLIRWNENYEA